jgi:hypothetical protein
MLARLRAGQTTTHDISFYMHELKESVRMKKFYRLQLVFCVKLLALV